MAQVNVDIVDGSRDTYAEATKWVIDSNEMLHILGGEGNLGSYNRGRWSAVNYA